ncbi:hypothetical protein BDR05DRAFT_193760 [Suillus weaverae]|nr:hypothetical protein BDR05DRAFT_193760 [Suillus weaverae]
MVHSQHTIRILCGSLSDSSWPTRLTLPISRTLADAILSLLNYSDAVLAAIPLPTHDSPSEIIYGTAARIALLARPRNQSSPTQLYLLSLHGIQRIRFPSPIQIH